MQRVMVQVRGGGVFVVGHTPCLALCLIRRPCFGSGGVVRRFRARPRVTRRSRPVFPRHRPATTVYPREQSETYRSAYAVHATGSGRLRISRRNKNVPTTAFTAVSCRRRLRGRVAATGRPRRKRTVRRGLARRSSRGFRSRLRKTNEKRNENRWVFFRQGRKKFLPGARRSEKGRRLAKLYRSGRRSCGVRRARSNYA